MKFKQYKLILESDKKEEKDPHPMFKDMSHYRKEVDEDDVIKLIKDKCDVKNYLYRGFEDDGDYYIIDGSKGKRASKNTTNYYTLIIDDIFKNDSSYKEYPLRSESIICSTSKKTAEHYGNVYVILPFKGVDIGYIGSDDIWRTDIEIGDLEFKIQEWNRIYEAIGISDGRYWDVIEGLTREHRDALFTLKQAVEEEYTYRMEEMDEDDDDYDADYEDYEASEDDIEEYVESSIPDIEGHSYTDLEDVVENIGDKNLFKYGFMAKMFGCEELSAKEIEKIIRDHYDPYDLGFELIKTERLNQHTDHEDIECWFGDKCVAVSMDQWKNIKDKL